MKLSFQDAMNDYFGHRDMKLTRWQRFKLRWYLRLKGRQYRARRRRILHNEAKHRAKRLFAATLRAPSLFAKIASQREDVWVGGTLIVPPGVDEVFDGPET